MLLFKKKENGNKQFLKSSRAISKSNIMGNPNKSWWRDITYPSPRGRQSQLPFCTHYLEFGEKSTPTQMDYRSLWQWWMITTDTSFRGYADESTILHNKKHGEDNHSKKKKASNTEQRNSERNRFLNNEIYFEHYCGWNYFPLKTKGSHQLYILSSYDTKK